MAKDIPALSASQLGENARPVERIREELQVLLGFRGDPLDAAITYRQAIERGLIDTLGRALTGTPSYTNVYPISLGGVGSVDVDLTPPPTPTGLTVQAGFTQLVVQWNAPSYSQGHGNKQTNVYAVKKAPDDATLPTFEAGVTPRVFVAPGALNVVSLPSELNTRWHIWITFETVDGVESLTPAGGVNGYNLAGAFPTTGQDITQLLGILTGQIRESQLYASLAEPIRSIIRRADDSAEDALRSALATHEASRRAVAGLLAEIAARGTAIAQTQVLIAQGDTQLAALITALQATVNNPTTGVAATALALDLVETLASDTADGVVAVAGRTSLLESTVDNSTTGVVATAAALDTVKTLVNDGANGVTATASRVSTLQSQVAGTAASGLRSAIETEALTRANETGDLYAQWTVKLDVGGYVSGYGLASTSTSSSFIIRSDRFAVAPPAGSGVTGDVFPFIIQATPTTINGVAIPAGVYMDAAYIINLSAMWARFGSLIADSIAVGQISAANLTLGDGTVGGDLKHSSYAPGSGVTPGSGWKLGNDGVLRASGAVIYGTIYASAGVFAGSLSAATGTFSGDISAATGTFAGSLNVNSGGSSRMEITSTRIKIFNGGVERVRLGDLS